MKIKEESKFGYWGEGMDRRIEKELAKIFCLFHQLHA
jgi:hypothetical protein